MRFNLYYLLGKLYTINQGEFPKENNEKSSKKIASIKTYNKITYDKNYDILFDDNVNDVYHKGYLEKEPIEARIYEEKNLIISHHRADK